MVLIGFLAFLDPPKETTKAAIQALMEYGVQVKILTGDNEKVTRAICKQVGLNVDRILLGSDLEKLNDRRLGELAETVRVFAKLSAGAEGPRCPGPPGKRPQAWDTWATASTTRPP